MDVILNVENASFAYVPGRPIFQNLSFRVEAGQVFSLLGRNGIGKSTLLKCILNLLHLSEGAVFLMGSDVKRLDPVRIASCAGYVPQTHQPVFPFSVFDFVLMGRAPRISAFRNPGKEDCRLAMQSLEKIGIGHLADKTISEISGGERQLVMIARAITQTPRLLVFDEPTSHLDLANQLNVLSVIEMLAMDGISVVMSSHFPDHGFLLSQHIAVMNDGRLVAEGTAEDVITPDNLRAAYGIDIDVCYVREAGRRVCIPRRGSETGSRMAG